MTNAKPGVIQLACNSVKTTRSHFGDLRSVGLPFFMMVAITTLVEQLGLAHSRYFAGLELVNLYFSACFALAWQRRILLEFRPSPRVNPFMLRQGERAFIAITTCMIIICIVGATASAAAVTIFCCHVSTPSIRFETGIVAGIIVFLLLVVVLAPFQFILPAKSVNAPISLRQARDISRGLVLRLVTGTLLTTLMPVMLLLFVQQWIGPFIVFQLLGLSQQSLSAGLAIFVFANLPSILISFLVAALSIVVLTRLYQWSVQNRPLPSTLSHPYEKAL